MCLWHVCISMYLLDRGEGFGREERPPDERQQLIEGRGLAVIAVIAVIEGRGLAVLAPGLLAAWHRAAAAFGAGIVARVAEQGRQVYFGAQRLNG